MLAQGPFGRPNLAAISGADGQGILAALFLSQTSFPAPLIQLLGAQVIAPVLFDSAALTVFLPPAVTTGNQVVPSVFNSSLLTQFPAPTVGVVVLPSTFNSADLTLFPQPLVAVTAPLIVTPGVFINSDLTVFPPPFIAMQFQFVAPNVFENQSQFPAPTVEQSAPEYVYDYPIGTQLGSDYGIRESMTFYKQRLVLGHRYGRRR